MWIFFNPFLLIRADFFDFFKFSFLFNFFNFVNIFFEGRLFCWFFPSVFGCFGRTTNCGILGLPHGTEEEKDEEEKDLKN